MWIDDLRQALVRGAQRATPWPPRERVLDEATYRRIVSEAIDLQVVEAAEDVRSGAGVPNVPVFPPPEPAARRRTLVSRWLTSSMGRDWLLQADRRLRDLDAIPSAELPTWLERLLRAAIARRPLEATSTTELLVDSAINVLTAPEPLEPDVLGYLHATQLLRDGQTTNLGRVLLRLEGRDAVRWLLVTELIQSTGPGDPHRLSQATAELLLARPEDTVWDGRHEDESPEFPHAWSTFKRFESLNLLWTNPDPLVRGYRLWPEGAAILREVSSSDFPMRAVAGALLEQDAVPLVSDRRYRAGAERRAADWVVETMAHGLRNALGPIGFALEELGARVPNLTREPAFARIGGGVERSLKLIQDLVMLSSGARADAEPFDVAAALRDVVAFANGGGVALDVAAVKGVRVAGSRVRFVHALADLIRNARRHARAEQSSRIEVATERGARTLRVIVDDNGTGVPRELRDRIFQTGFSTHPQGTGQGLSLLTEVVRDDHGGTITVDDSPLGGARFVLTIPLEEES
jgi:signal transduction histidine kinase